MHRGITALRIRVDVDVLPLYGPRTCHKDTTRYGGAGIVDVTAEMIGDDCSDRFAAGEDDFGIRIQQVDPSIGKHVPRVTHL